MKKIIIIALCLGALAQCKKEEAEPEPQPAPTPYAPPTGTISGHVTQWDQYGVAPASLNTVTVSLIGSQLSTVSDASGNYTLTGVPAGMYTIASKKPGSRTCEKQQVNFPGSGVLFSNTNVSDSATFSINTAVVKDTLVSSTNRVKATVILNSHPLNRSAFVIFGQSAMPDINNPSSYTHFFSFNIPPNATTVSYVHYGFVNSGTYYAKVYPFSSAPDGTQYYNYATAKQTFIGQGPAMPQTYTVTIP